MDFIDQLKQFSKRVETLKNSISTEEATKTSIIMPFFSLLGYDVFNPEEFIPEFTADVGIKKGEKVDYAILSNGEPVILIECKSINEQLEKHDSQLFRYFGTSKAKFAILTNGIIYKFYTDLDESNKMDEKPFLEIDILDLKETQVPELKKFHKNKFDIQSIFSTASDLKYSNEFKNVLSVQLQNPQDDFIKYFVSQVYNGKATQKVIEKFRPILKKSLNNYINELMNEKIKNALDAQNASTEQVKEPVQELVQETVIPESKIVTTDEELESYFIVKNLLREIVSISDISYKDNERYMAITYKNKITKWICRLYFNGSQKYIVLNDTNKTRHDINTLYEIETYKNELISVLKNML